MAKSSKSIGVSLYKSKPKKKGKAHKSVGPKVSKTKEYRGQGR